MRIVLDIETDFKFFAITPALNLNFYSKTFEIEWLFWGLYFCFGQIHKPNDFTINPLKNENGITIRELKEYLSKFPETDSNGNLSEVWIMDTKSSTSNIAKMLWRLNETDILIEHES